MSDYLLGEGRYFDGVRIGFPDEHGACERHCAWAKAFATSQRGPLRERTAADVRRFLEERTKAESAAAKAQAREALIILYRDPLRLDLRAREAAGAAEAGFADAVTDSEAVEARHGELLDRMRGEIRTVQELLGHSDVNTTMIYTHVIGFINRYMTERAGGRRAAEPS